MFNKILIASDGSANAGRAVDAACALAAKLGASLDVVHVLGHGRLPEEYARLAAVEHLVPDAETKPPHEIEGAGIVRTEATGTASEYRIWHAIGEQIVSRAEHSARKLGVKINASHIAEGDFSESIVDVARLQDIDLIVLGTRGLSEITELLMGSVSHKVCQLARRACLLVP